MAISFVQSQTAGSTTNSNTTLPFTWGSNTKTGDLIVVCFAYNSNINAVTSITDSQSNTYVKAVNDIASGVYDVEVWYALNITGGTTPTVTINLTSGQPNVATAYEFSGVSTTLGPDKTNGNHGNSTSPTPGTTGTLSNANEVAIVVAMNGNGNATYSQTAGWSGLLNANSTATGIHPFIGSEYQIVSATTALNPTFTQSPAAIWECCIATFQAAPLVIQTPAPITQIPNKYVGPMALRNLFHQPQVPQYVPPPVLTPTGYPAGLFGGAYFGQAYFGDAYGQTGILNYDKVLTGALSFTGSIAKATTHLLAAGLSFIGSIQAGTPTSYLLSATLSFSGNINKLLRKTPFTGTLSFAGNFVRSLIRTLSGTLSFAGTFLAGIPTSYLLSGALSFSGNLSKQTAYPLIGALSFAGSALKRTIKSSYSGALSFVGALISSHTYNKLLTGRLSFLSSKTGRAGFSIGGLLLTLTHQGRDTIVKQIFKAMPAGVSFSGNLIKSVSYLLTGGLSFTGRLVKSILKSVVGGALSFSGSISRLTSKIASGALNFIGSIQVGTPVSYLLNATLTFSGALSKRTTHSLTGSLSFTGALRKAMSLAKTIFTGGLSFIGSFLTGAVHKLSVTGALSFSGTFSKQADKVLKGVLSFSGNIKHAFAKLFNAILSFSGNVIPGKSLLKKLFFTLVIPNPISLILSIYNALSFMLKQSSSISMNLISPSPITFSLSVPANIIQSVETPLPINLTLTIPAPISLTVIGN